MMRDLNLSLLLILVCSVLASCGDATLLVAPTDAPAVDGGTPAPAATAPLEEVLPTRTPAPTATPGLIARGVERAAAQTGLTGTYFLWLSTADWVNLGISLATVVLGYVVGTLLIRRVLPSLARRTPSELDDAFAESLGPDLRWLVVIIALNWATVRLTFLSAGLKDILGDVYFLCGLLVGLRAGWRLIDLFAESYRERARRAESEEHLSPIIVLLVRGARAALLTTGITILLSHFGVNVTVIAAAVALGALAISLGARNTISDTIAGFIILVDRPFRVGDRIEIQGEGTWGDVVEIGLRTTRIRTRDNRMVIVPNSIIGQNQVVNFTYPDPTYRIETRVGVAYGTDIDAAECLIVDTVQQVSGVLADREVEVLYDEMGDSAMILCVRWWIQSYENARRMIDRVHRALQRALDAAGIEMPYPTQTLHLLDESESTESAF